MDPQDWRGRDVRLRVGLELGDDVGGDVADDVHAARLDLGDLGGDLRDGADDEVLERGLAAPVLVEGLEADQLVALPLDELPRPRSHRGGRPERLVAHRLDVLLGHDGEEDEPLQQEREGLVGDDVDRLRIHHADFLDGADIAVLGRLFRLVDHAIEGVLDVLRGHRLPVVEAHALAELELPLGVRQRLPGGGERGLKLKLGVPVDQGVEHVDIDQDAHALEVHVGVEGGGVRDEGDDECVLRLRLGRGGRGGERGERESGSH